MVPNVTFLRRLQRPVGFAPLVAGLVSAYPIAAFLDSSGIALVRGELGVIELTGAACFLVAAVAFAVIWLVAARRRAANAHGGR
jgi:hypothetical protein